MKPANCGDPGPWKSLHNDSADPPLGKYVLVWADGEFRVAHYSGMGWWCRDTDGVLREWRCGPVKWREWPMEPR
jgi:hypothetical protein